MHFDAHVVSKVSESNQHIDDKFCRVPGLVVVKKILHNPNTFASHASISTSYNEFSNYGFPTSWWIWGPSKLSAFNFSIVNPDRVWCAVVGKVSCLGPHQRNIDDIYSARHQFLPKRPVPFFHVMLYSVPTIPHCTESMSTWWTQNVVPTKNSPSSGECK